MPKLPATKRRLAALGLLASVAVCGTAQGEIYVYEMPNGTRMVTDHQLNDKRARLVRVTGAVRDAGKLAAQKNSPVFREDPSTYDRLIQRYADEYGVEFTLVKAVMTVESAFNPYSVSNKGACGLMQIMPQTAKRYGVLDIYNPVENVRAGVQYLRHLSELFNNKIHLVIAAYNAGENAVLQYQGIPPYEETQSYVKKVLYYKNHYTTKSPIITADATLPHS
jgi:soluble lytic murein transglycosylase-like protein